MNNDLLTQRDNGMRSPFTLADDANTTHLGIADLSFLTRFGVKGAGAAAWLSSQGIPIPERPNTWCWLSQRGIVARLGMNEFLIEDSLDSNVAPRLAESCQQPPSKVYPVLRQDLAIALCGTEIHQLLLQTCSINFSALSLNQSPVILTSMVGVAVIVIPQSEQHYRIWCDGTFGAYLWRTLWATLPNLAAAL